MLCRIERRYLFHILFPGKQTEVMQQRKPVSEIRMRNSAAARQNEHLRDIENFRERIFVLNETQKDFDAFLHRSKLSNVSGEHGLSADHTI